MKILHLMLACFYIDNYSYQENLLPKYHKRMGHEVSIIASTVSFDGKGKTVDYSGVMSYINENGIPVQRLHYKRPVRVMKRLRVYDGLKQRLDEIAPDLIFVHGCQFMDAFIVSQYARSHENVKVYVDNHADLNNSANNYLSLHILHKIIWRHCAKELAPITEKFYGVLPARVDFLKEIYRLPEEKCELLVLGADDHEVMRANNPLIRNEQRRKYNLTEKSICILVGGKIDHNKPQVIDFMKAVNSFDNQNIKLLVFGTVVPELENVFQTQMSEKVDYIGWLSPPEIYEIFAIADLIAFPGLHSVLWEQAVGMGKPCIFKRIRGFEHINLGGNCLFFEEDTIDEYRRVLKNAIELLPSLHENAQEKGMKVFSYCQIARKSIE